MDKIRTHGKAEIPPKLWLSIVAGILGVFGGCSSSDSGITLRLDGRKHQVITAVVVSPDGTHVLAGTYGWVGVYTLTDFKLIGETKPDGSGERIGDCLTLVFSPDGKTFVVDGHQGHSEWDLASGRMLPAPINAIGASFDWRSKMEARRMSPDKRTSLVVKEITSPAQPRVVEVRDTAARKTLRFSLEHKDFVNDAIYSPDGNWIVTGSGNAQSYRKTGRIQIWDAKTGELLGEKDTGSSVSGLAFTPDGQILVSGHGFELKSWKTETLLRK